MKRYIMMGITCAIALGCSNDDDKAAKQKECDAKAANIAKAADEYGIPEQGACNNTSVTAQFASACADLKRCNAELAAM